MKNDLEKLADQLLAGSPGITAICIGCGRVLEGKGYKDYCSKKCYIKRG